MDRREQKWMKQALRLDRPVAAEEAAPVFDLELLHRGARDSLLVARMFRRAARYLNGAASPGGSPGDPASLPRARGTGET